MAAEQGRSHCQGEHIFALRHALCLPSLKGSPTPANVGVEKVPNFLSVHLTGSGAIAGYGRRSQRGTTTGAAQKGLDARETGQARNSSDRRSSTMCGCNGKRAWLYSYDPTQRVHTSSGKHALVNDGRSHHSDWCAWHVVTSRARAHLC